MEMHDLIETCPVTEGLRRVRAGADRAAAAWAAGQQSMRLQETYRALYTSERMRSLTQAECALYDAVGVELRRRAAGGAHD